MRVGNVLVVAIGLAAVGAAGVIAWRWRRLPSVAPRPPIPETWGAAAVDALRSLGAVLAAGVLAGILVPGVVGRLVMRVLGATSGDAAQGKITEAEEAVGAITFDGTIGFVIFTGVFGGLFAVVVWFALRRWLPKQAGSAGIVLAVLMLGSLGVSDPLAPENTDFQILTPRWFAVLLVVATAALFGLTFAALAARFDARLKPLSTGASAIPGHLGLVVAIIPPLAVGAAVYVAARAIVRGRLIPVLNSTLVRRVGQVAIGVLTMAAAVSTTIAVVDIL